MRALKDPASIEPLIGFLRDDDGRMRQETACTLESLGDVRAEMPLIAALVDFDGDVRLRVARALGDKRADDPLCVHLRDPDNIVRFYAAQALGRIGDPTALPALRTALGRTAHDEARRAIETAIAELSPPVRKASSATRGWPDPSLDELVELLNRDTRDRATLGGFGHRERIEAIGRTLDDAGGVELMRRVY